ncbi:MAG TPA: hypothetical protein VF297_14740 [Pyrinomonadaceae bacterium]
MGSLNPALIVTVGDFAEGVAARARESLCRAHGVEKVPAVFQFVSMSGAQQEDERAIMDAYTLALSEHAIAEAGSALRAAVGAERLETYIIAPLQPEAYELARRASAAVRENSVAAIAGGLNAVFLVGKRLLSLNAEGLRDAARRLDGEMASKGFPFNRCFFVDEFNESGQTITTPEHLTELVADYIFMAIASGLSDALRADLPPYSGDGAHHVAYGSFCWNRLHADGRALHELLLSCLASDIAGRLFKEPGASVAATAEPAGGWFAENFRKAPKEAPKDSDTNALLRDFRHESEKRLDDFCFNACAALGHNLHSYGQFLEACLEQGVVELERRWVGLEEIKADINDKLVRLLIGEPPRIVVEPPPPPREGRLMRLFGPVLRLFARKRVSGNTAPALPPPDTLEIMLEKAERRYDYQLGLLEGHLELYRRIDMACAGIERFRRLTYRPKASPRASAFDIDVVDEEFAEEFYASAEYTSCNRDVSDFTSGGHAREFVTAFSAYPEGDPAALLLAYCRQRLDFVGNYGVGKMLQLKARLKGKRRLSLSAPFWRPQLFGAAERLRIISAADPGGLDVDAILNGLSTATRLVLINTNGAPETSDGCLTIVQISYGRPIESIFDISLAGE